MATIKFLTRSKSKNASIYLKLRSGNMTISRKTGLNIDGGKWNGKTTPYGSDEVSIKNVKHTLRKLETHVFDALNKLVSDNNTITSEWLQSEIDVFFGRTGINNENVVEYINYVIKTSNIRENASGGLGLSEGRLKSYKAMRNLFIKFQGNKNYNIKDLGKNVFDKFRTWLTDNGYSPTTIHKRLSDLRTVCKDAKSNGFEVSDTLDLVKIKRFSSYDSADMDVITLSEHEIQQIEKLHLDTGALINARKWLILACYTGQRGSDLINKIIADNFQHTTQGLAIIIKQGKGNKRVEIPILPKVQKIFDEGLPYKQSIKTLNVYFKELGKMAKINTPTMGRKKEIVKGVERGVKKMRPKWEYLSTHIGRRTFATLHYQKIPTASIMKVTGHKKESTFLEYINKADNRHLSIFTEFYDNQKDANRQTNRLKIV